MEFMTSLNITTVSTSHDPPLWCFQVLLSNFFSVNRDVTKRGHPEAIRSFLPEITKFARFNHFNVLHPVLRSVDLPINMVYV